MGVLRCEFHETNVDLDIKSDHFYNWINPLTKIEDYYCVVQAETQLKGCEETEFDGKTVYYTFKNGQYIVHATIDSNFTIDFEPDLGIEFEMEMESRLKEAKELNKFE